MNGARIEVAVIGGRGKLGSALAQRLSHAGVSVVIGSRGGPFDPEAPLPVLPNVQAAESADLSVIAIPASSYDAILPGIASAVEGRVVISTGVPFPWTGSSAALEASRLLPGALVVGALHTVSHVTLSGTHHLDEDTFLTSDSEAALEQAEALLSHVAGLRTVRAGALKNSQFTESATHLLIAINRAARAHAGLRATNLPAASV